MDKVPTFKEVINFKEDDYRKVKIKFVGYINSLPDDLAITVLLVSFGLLKEYADVPTLKDRRIKFIKNFPISYDTMEDIEKIAVEELAKYMLLYSDLPSLGDFCIIKSYHEG